MNADNDLWVELRDRDDNLITRVLNLRSKCDRLEAERAELVAALGAMLTYFGMDEDEWSKPTFNKARAALEKVK